VLLDFCVLAVHFFAALITVHQGAASAKRGDFARVATVNRALKQTIGLYPKRVGAHRANYFNLRALGCLVAGIRAVVQSGFTALNIVDWFTKLAPTIGAVDRRACAVLHYISPYGHYIIIPHSNQTTTMIAAHRTGRRCYGMEIAPRYADVILKRCEAEGLTVERTS